MSSGNNIKSLFVYFLNQTFYFTHRYTPNDDIFVKVFTYIQNTFINKNVEEKLNIEREKFHIIKQKKELRWEIEEQKEGTENCEMLKRTSYGKCIIIIMET